MATQTGKTQPRLREERENISVTYGQEHLGEEIFLELIHIASGDFMMGSSDDEEGRYDREGPQHKVSVPEFWMGQYPVTQQEWRIVSGYEKVERDLDADPSRFKDVGKASQNGNRRPVEQVSWDEAVEFCDRLSNHTGRTYRLPTEAEWEYACRGGTTTPFHFGPTLSAKYSNYRAEEMYGPGAEGEYRQETVDVDHFKVANDFGLCDMHGNVFEWCQDHWHEHYEGAPTDGSAWIDRDAGDRTRILRGGSWYSDPRDCRSAYRAHNVPEDKSKHIGFRVILSPRSTSPSR